MSKLEHQHKHVMSLIRRDADKDGWTTVSEKLYPVLSGAIPSELAEFEETENGCRARLTEEGNNVLDAMKWL